MTTPILDLLGAEGESLLSYRCRGISKDMLHLPGPDFVDRSRGPVAVQMLALGCMFVAMAIVSDGMYALLAGSVGQWLKGTRAFLWAERYIAGSIYIGLGVTAALADAGKH